MAPRRELFSFSKMSRYGRCPKSYEHHYVNKLYRSDSSEALVIGSMVHQALESYYLGEVNHPIEAMDKAWLDWFEKAGLEGMQTQLLSLRQDVSYLAWRATVDCSDPAVWIRNANGSIPKPGGLGMNKTYKSEYEKLSIEPRRAYVDQTAGATGSWDDKLSLADVYTTTYAIIEAHQDIPGLTAVMSCEFPLSKQKQDDKGKRLFVDDDGSVTTTDTGNPAVNNPVILPRTGHYYTGSIDLIAEILGQIAIIDHKTSKGDPPDIVSVAYHDQLLLYAWAYHQRFGVKPYYVGINHLRTGTCVLAPIQWDLVEDAVARFEDAIDAAATKIFVKKAPFEYQSPCLGGAKSINDAQRICVYLGECYPQLAEILNAAPPDPSTMIY